VSANQSESNLETANTRFGNTDAERLVVAQSIELFSTSQPLVLASGEKLGPIQVAFETYGTLSAGKDNTIFVCHALTGDAHAAGKYSLEDAKAGWWDEFIGPGRGIDTDKYFVICANVLGGCTGTTGPTSISPQTGERYGLNFPFITIEDMVQVHRALVAHLGIKKLAAVIGGSLGGMQVLEWVAQAPDDLQNAIVLASAAQLSAQGIAFNTVGRRAIYADPNFKDGEYHQNDEVPKYGLALARMIAHITYLSESSIEMKFGRKLQDESDEFAFELQQETEFQIESYLHYQGNRFVERFDANSYLYLTRAMDYFDLAARYGGLATALKKTSARFLIASYTTDWLFASAQSRELVSTLISNEKHVSFCELESPFGHDAFLLEIDQLTQIVRAFLQVEDKV